MSLCVAPCYASLVDANTGKVKVQMSSRGAITEKIDSYNDPRGGPFPQAYILIGFGERTVTLEEVYTKVQEIAVDIVKTPVAERPAWAWGIITPTARGYNEELEKIMFDMLLLGNDQHVSQVIKDIRAHQEILRVLAASF